MLSMPTSRWRKQMLGGGEQNPCFMQAGGVTHASDVVALRLDRKIVQIHAAENDAGFSRGRHQTNVTVHPCV